MSDTVFAARAPGRVNLIGEHTDYNGGWVLPAALSVGLEVELKPRSDDTASIATDGFDGPVTRSLDEAACDHWSDTALGALREARSMGLLQGGDLSVHSTIPAGAGLSSSAAISVAILKAARDAAGAAFSDTEIAVAARRVETDYIGVPVGIMDQMAVAIARPGQAIALDTQSLDYTVVKLPAGYSVEIIHSGVVRQLSEGRYRIRKEECDAAREAFGQDALCLLDPQAIESKPDLDDTIRRRARHCATEHRRVLAAVDALAAGDAPALGVLMQDSHVSMRDDFAMSVPAIDALVADAMELGATGARLTGGGFGGCIVALVPEEHRADWLAKLLKRQADAWFVDRIAG
ncbi:galactokinase [Qipengyuania sp. DSG2-2]|uniref:galactokinase n=1 Tax=Qipengyuania sp. DGS2-2 TaxID=3349631 RepID=UPI0036D3B5B9